MFIRHEVQYKTHKKREAVIVLGPYAAKRPIKRSARFYNIIFQDTEY